MMNPSWSMALVVLLASSSGCSPDETLAVEARSVCSEAAGCRNPGVDEPCEKCGSNSPEIDHYGFHDLNLAGLRNDAGLSIEAPNGRAQIFVNGQAYDLAVTGGQIQAHGWNQVVTGQALIGAEILIHAQDQPLYIIRIVSVRPMAFPFSRWRSFEAYRLEFRRLDGMALTNVCKNPPHGNPADPANPDAPPPEEELLGMLPAESVVFEGDRIDAEAKTMSVEPDPQWFNIGCAGHTLAKLHITENTIASQIMLGRGPTPELWAKRQATLKLLAADYCGRGFAFTVAGVPLLWRGDATDAMSRFYRGTPTQLEARWNEWGAVCLEYPRLLSGGANQIGSGFAKIWGPIHDRCNPPRCEDLDPTSLGEALRVSGMP